MHATNPATFLWFVAIIVLGNYILLNLFLAILLENFSASGSAGGASTANSAGGTLAAAAKTAQLLAWMQDLLEGSWFAKMLRRRNRVAALRDTDGSHGEIVAPPAAAHRGSDPGLAGIDKRRLLAQDRWSAAGQGGQEQEHAAGGLGIRGPAGLRVDGSGADDGFMPSAHATSSMPGLRTSVAGGYPAAAAAAARRR
jgi:hypothetical protein